jgi:hypothetical protein
MAFSSGDIFLSFSDMWDTKISKTRYQIPRNALEEPHYIHNIVVPMYFFRRDKTRFYLLSCYYFR